MPGKDFAPPALCPYQGGEVSETATKPVPALSV